MRDFGWLQIHEQKGEGQKEADVHRTQWNPDPTEIRLSTAGKHRRVGIIASVFKTSAPWQCLLAHPSKPRTRVPLIL